MCLDVIFLYFSCWEFTEILDSAVSLVILLWEGGPAFSWGDGICRARERSSSCRLTGAFSHGGWGRSREQEGKHETQIPHCMMWPGSRTWKQIPPLDRKIFKVTLQMSLETGRHATLGPFLPSASAFMVMSRVERDWVVIQVLAWLHPCCEERDFNF